MKKVRFAETVTVHEVGSSEDDKSNRSGLEWMQAAVDRKRFQTRINRVGLTLNDILRKKVKEIKIN